MKPDLHAEILEEFAAHSAQQLDYEDRFSGYGLRLGAVEVAEKNRQWREANAAWIQSPEFKARALRYVVESRKRINADPVRRMEHLARRRAEGVRYRAARAAK